MPQSQYKNIGALKSLARIQTGQYFGTLIGTLLLNMLITFAAVNIASALIPANTPTGYVLNYILVFIVQVVCSVLNVGMSFIFLKSACNMRSTIGDLFYGFKEHLAKALKIGAVIAVIESICMIPVDFATLHLTNAVNSMPLLSEYSVNELSAMITNGTINRYQIIEAYNVLMNTMMRYYAILLVCMLIYLILTLSFFPSFYMILDFPNWDAATILKKSFEVMGGNRIRLLLLYLSFIPLYLLSFITCGLALIWVIPYMKMTETNFYLDLMAVRNRSLQP